VPADKYASANTTYISEGRFDDVMRDRAGTTHGERSVATFVRMVVLDVISDPTTVDSVKLSHYQHDLGVTNPAYASVAPRNSIIARPVMSKGAGAADKVMVLFPFFPPHLSLPAKPGEHVWAIFEQPDAKVSEIGYWMCRVVGPDFVEDVNYTHMDRQFDPSFLPGLSDVFNGTDNPIYEFRNGAVDSKSGQRYTIPETSSLPGNETAYETLLTKSDAALITRYESVPRYRKRPVDIAFEGSNNALIVLGTDRTAAYADTSTTTPNLGVQPKPVSADLFQDGAGSIDLVVGRGQTPATGGTAEPNNLLAGGPTGRKELGKSHKDLAPNEGDIDLVHDRSRVLLAQQTNADVNFALDTYLNGLISGPGSSPSAKSSGAIVAKSDRIRIVGRSDIALITTSQGTTDSNNQLIDSPDNTKWAGVVVRANGDVYVQPIKAGKFDVETQSCYLKVDTDNIDAKTAGAEFKMTASDATTTVSATSIKATGSSVAITTPSTTVSQLFAAGAAPMPVAFAEQTATALTAISIALAALAAAFVAAKAAIPVEVGLIAATATAPDVACTAAVTAIASAIALLPTKTSTLT
jgi:hypothetical protein